MFIFVVNNNQYCCDIEFKAKNVDNLLCLRYLRYWGNHAFVNE